VSIQFPVNNRYSGEVQFTATIEADDNTPHGVRFGLAVKWAIETKTDLSSADLSSANLRYANLSSADLSYAKNLGDWTMPDGIKWSQYLSAVVPALLTAGGKTMDEIQASGCWDCHSWENCPMHVAFGIGTPDEGPPLLRARIVEFIQFFDGRMIPAPWEPAPKTAVAAS